MPLASSVAAWDDAALGELLPGPVSVAAHDVVDEAVFGRQYRVVDVGVERQDDRGALVAADGADGVVPGTSPSCDQ